MFQNYKNHNYNWAMFVCYLVVFARYYNESYKIVGITKKYKNKTNKSNRQGFFRHIFGNLTCIKTSDIFDGLFAHNYFLFLQSIV